MISLRLGRLGMTKLWKLLFLCLILFLVLTITFSALAQQPRIIKFDVLGAKTTTPDQINDQGQIVGAYCANVDATSCQAFLRDPDGTVTKIQLPGPILPNPVFEINGHGEITGSYLDANSVSHGFLREMDGTITSFEAPGAGHEAFAGTYPAAINDEGTIVGSYSDKNADLHGFIRHPDGEFNDFDVPASLPADPQALGTHPTGINDSGLMVGIYTDHEGRFRGFLRRHGHFTTFKISRAEQTLTIPQAINTEGVVIGSFDAPDNVYYGFLRFPDGHVVLFKVPGAGGFGTFGTQPLSINDEGVVTGYYMDARGVNHGFLHDPKRGVTEFSVKGAGTGSGDGTLPQSINNGGVIVGYYLDDNFVSHGFIRIP